MKEIRLKVLENRVLRRLFGSKKDKVTGEWRRLHKEELYALYSSTNIRVIKSRRMIWAGHVARTGREDVHVVFGWETLRGEDHLEDPGIDGKRLLKCILEKLDGGINWIDLNQDRDRWRAVVNEIMNFRIS